MKAVLSYIMSCKLIRSLAFCLLMPTKISIVSIPHCTSQMIGHLLGHNVKGAVAVGHIVELFLLLLLLLGRFLLFKLFFGVNP